VNRAPEHNWKTELHGILCRHFSEDELHTLCFKLEIDYEDLGGVGKSGKARELVAAIERRNIIHELVRIIQEQRPSVSLSEILEAAKKEVTATLTPQSIHSLYKAAAEELLNQMGQHHTYYPYALACRRQLSEIIEQSQLQGDTDQLKDELQEIIDRLDRLALDLLDTSFRELSDQTQLTGEQEKAEPPLNDPLSLVELRSEGPVWRILANAKEARTHSDWGKVLRICERAITCESKHRNQSARATALLFMADALAQNGRVQESIDKADRARRSFLRQSENRNVILTDLVLTQLRQKTRRDVHDAYDSYGATRTLCKQLESKARESRLISEAEFYSQIVSKIDQAMENIEEAVAKEALQSCCLKAIPVLQLSDALAMVSQPAKVIKYLTADKFKIGGQVYLLHPLDKAERGTLELQAGATHFALPVPEDGWPSPKGKKEQDFALVRAQVTPANREGPGVRWTGQEWTVGRFERKETGKIIFAPPKRHTIGGEITIENRVAEIEEAVTLKDYGYVIGLLKPEGSIE
jgi:hypothetical protein